MIQLELANLLSKKVLDLQVQKLAKQSKKHSLN